MNTQEQLASYFEPGYWSKWEAKFGHNFWTVHVVRTEDYNDTFIKSELAGKSVLEVGGYPGLLIAMYLINGCKVTAIDSPMYRPEHYLEFIDKWKLRSFEHDINYGAPALDEHFDAMVMSDVIMHNDGFPDEFMKWALEHCDKLYIINYAVAEGNINKPSQHTLVGSWPIPSAIKIKKHMETLGAKFAYAKDIKDRELIVFERSDNE